MSNAVSHIVRQIGEIVRTHGVVGELKVRPETDDPERFQGLTRVWIGRSEESATEYSVTGVRLQSVKQGIAVLMTVEGIDSREAAGMLAGRGVFAHPDDLPALDDDEVYVSDLIGLKAVDPDGQSLGEVADVLELPAQMTLVIRRPGGAEVLVPFVDAFVGAIDTEAGSLEIRPIEGLIDPDEQEVVA